VNILLIACTEPGVLSNGPSIILTNTIREWPSGSHDAIRVVLLKEQRDAAQPDTRNGWGSLVTHRATRNSWIRNRMLRAALGGPLIRAEKEFLRVCSDESVTADVAVWFGLSWDPVSLRLPAACHCPVVHHPTDSITRAEVNRVPTLFKGLRIRIARNLERRLLRAGYVRSVYNSPLDAEAGRALAPTDARESIVALPCGIDDGLFAPPAVKVQYSRTRIAFSGVMNYRPNVDAALFLVKKVLPCIKADVEVRIVGRNPLPEVEKLQESDPRVIVTGAVANVADELRLSDIYVAPMVSGVGILNKVLEAMACGLPVVLTPLVAGNFPRRSKSMLVAQSAPEIALAIDMLAADRDLRLRLAADSVNYVNSPDWSWNARAANLRSLLAACAQPKRVLT